MVELKDRHKTCMKGDVDSTFSGSQKDGFKIQVQSVPCWPSAFSINRFNADEAAADVIYLPLNSELIEPASGQLQMNWIYHTSRDWAHSNNFIYNSREWSSFGRPAKLRPFITHEIEWKGIRKGSHERDSSQRRAVYCVQSRDAQLLRGLSVHFAIIQCAVLWMELQRSIWMIYRRKFD